MGGRNCVKLEGVIESPEEVFMVRRIALVLALLQAADGASKTAMQPILQQTE